LDFVAPGPPRCSGSFGQVRLDVGEQLGHHPVAIRCGDGAKHGFIGTCETFLARNWRSPALGSSPTGRFRPRSSPQGPIGLGRLGQVRRPIDLAFSTSSLAWFCTAAASLFLHHGVANLALDFLECPAAVAASRPSPGPARPYCPSRPATGRPRPFSGAATAWSKSGMGPISLTVWPAAKPVHAHQLHVQPGRDLLRVSRVLLQQPPGPCRRSWFMASFTLCFFDWGRQLALGFPRKAASPHPGVAAPG